MSLVQESDGNVCLLTGCGRGASQKKKPILMVGQKSRSSNELRTWFGHEATKFLEFAKLYKAELKANAAAQKAVREIIRISREKTVTLFCGAKDPLLNQAAVLKEYLTELLSEPQQDAVPMFAKRQNLIVKTTIGFAAATKNHKTKA